MKVAESYNTCDLGPFYIVILLCTGYIKCSCMYSKCSRMQFLESHSYTYITCMFAVAMPHKVFPHPPPPHQRILYELVISSNVCLCHSCGLPVMLLTMCVYILRSHRSAFFCTVDYMNTAVAWGQRLIRNPKWVHDKIYYCGNNMLSWKECSI